MSSLNEGLAKKIFIPNYFCFGQQTIDHFNKIGANIKNFYVVGSLRQYYAEEDLKSKNTKNKKKYDICLISENLPGLNDRVRKERFESLKKIAENVERLTLEQNLKTVLALKRAPNTKQGEEEINFYRNIFRKNSPIIFADRIKGPYSNYETAYNSKIVIGSRSTLLLEVFARGGRILICNYKHEHYVEKNKGRIFERLEELNPLFDFDNYFSVHNKNYSIFRERALDLIYMDKELFENHKKNFANYMLIFDNNYSIFSKIEKKINFWLQ